MKEGISPNAGSHKTVVLIGADGFIGTSLMKYLCHAGWTVHPTVFRRPPEENEVFLDVTDESSFSGLPGGIPIVNASGLPDQKLPTRLMRTVHVDGMKNLIRHARRTNSPVIQLSSITVYGTATLGTGRTEQATRRRVWNPITSPLPYGRTKARAEMLLEKSGLPWTALRLPAVFGPGDSFFTEEIRTIIESWGDRLPDGGNKPVSIIPVGCIGPIIGKVLVHGPLNAARNAAGAHVSWKEILKAYAEAWDIKLLFSGKPKLSHYLNFSNPGMQMNAYYSRFGAEFPDDLLRTELDWEPEIDWHKTVREAAAEYQAAGR